MSRRRSGDFEDRYSVSDGTPGATCDGTADHRSDQPKDIPKSSRPNPGNSQPDVPSKCPDLAGRGPHAARLAVRCARRWYERKGRRAWRRTYPALIFAALVIASDRWPLA